jgi:hypothetical protein
MTSPPVPHTLGSQKDVVCSKLNTDVGSLLAALKGRKMPGKKECGGEGSLEIPVGFEPD